MKKIDWQTFLQWFFIMASAASIFGAWLAWASKTNGNETRELMKELHKDNQILLNTIDKRADQRQQQVIELLQMGFSENNKNKK